MTVSGADTALGAGRKSLPDFLPVIFANGEDCDIQGFDAFVRNKRVLFDSAVIEPDQSLHIVDRIMFFSSPLMIVAPVSSSRLVFGNFDATRHPVLTFMSDTRRLVMTKCLFAVRE